MAMQQNASTASYHCGGRHLALVLCSGSRNHRATKVTTGRGQSQADAADGSPAPARLEIGSGSASGGRGTGPFADHPAADLIPECPCDIGDMNLCGGTVHDRPRPADMPEKITRSLAGLLKMRWGWVTFEQSWHPDGRVGSSVHGPAPTGMRRYKRALKQPPPPPNRCPNSKTTPDRTLVSPPPRFTNAWPIDSPIGPLVFPQEHCCKHLPGLVFYWRASCWTKHRLHRPRAPRPSSNYRYQRGRGRHPLT